MLWYDDGPVGHGGSPLPPERRQNWALPSWVEARAVPQGQKRYLHQTGTEVLVGEDGCVRVRRAHGWEARRVGEEVEQWLIHVGYRWLAGTIEDAEAVYLVPESVRGGGRWAGTAGGTNRP